MPTTTEERADTRRLKKELHTQGVQLDKPRSRISELVDEIAIIKTDIVQFRKTLSKDLIDIIEKIDKRR